VNKVWTKGTSKYKLALFFSWLLASAFLTNFAFAETLDANGVLVDGAPAMSDQLVSTSQNSVGNWITYEGIPGGEAVVGDFVVGPGKVELEIKPGETKTVMISVTNRIGEERRFNLDIEDATASREPGKTVDLLGSERGPYTIKDYISIPQKVITVKHNERARIPVTISIPSDAEPGGRYGSVLVNTLAVEPKPGEEDKVASQSPIIARIGTLFFVTIPGEVDRSGKLKKLSLIPEKAWYEQGPITMGILFENTGSVHLTPFGTLSVTNMFGEEVGFVELDPWFALPKSLRFREVIWDNSHLLGKYTVTAKINRGYGDIIDTEILTFYVLPWKVLAGTFAGIFIVIFLVRYFYRNFEFRRRPTI
jgi:hypothetical protein